MLPDLDLFPLRTGGHRLDVGISLVLMLAACVCVWFTTGIGGHIRTLTDARADDVWFEADIARVRDDMTDRGANHYRTTVHPLFPLLTYPAVHAIQKRFSVDDIRAVRAVITATAGIWLAAFYFLLRLLRCRRLDATVFTLVAAATSAALFWTAIPETYEFGSLTILIVLIVAAIAERRTAVPVWVETAASAASMSILVTDFMVSLASLISRYRPKQAAQIAGNALIVVVLLWSLQKYFFTSAHFFIGEHDKGAPPSSSITALVVMFVHSFVAPEIWSGPNEQPGQWPMLSFQHAAVGHLHFLKFMALLCWVCLLGFAAWALLRLPQYRRFRTTLALSIAGQIVLHLAYGNETFLYALDWMPLFIAAAALATLTRWRRPVLMVATLFVITAGLHNANELENALNTVTSNATIVSSSPATIG